MNRIDTLFKEKKNHILSVYFTAGHPYIDSATSIIQELEKEHIDMVEIGIPFSDPMADGPTIQQSSHLALQNGMSLELLFEQLSNIREHVRIPLILMGYLNPIMQFGFERFCKECQNIGIDGIIIPDLPFEEYMIHYKDIADKHGIYMIMLITPETSKERISLIDKNTRGFIYMVSSASTTGVQNHFDKDKHDYFERIKSMSLTNPTLIGFGISNKVTLQSAFSHSHGAIVGSKFVSLLNESSSIRQAVTALKSALEV